MVTTGTKNAIAIGGTDNAWRIWIRLTNNQQTWVRWKTMWSGAFLERWDLVRITGISYNGMANQAQDMDTGKMIVVALDNLENSAVQNNDTVERLVISNTSLSASLVARDTKIARILTVITNLSTGGGSGGGGGGGTNNRKPQSHPGIPQAAAVRTVTRSVSSTAVPRVIYARTDTMPTLKRSGETFRGDVSGTELGIPEKTDGENQRGEHEHKFNNIY